MRRARIKGLAAVPVRKKPLQDTEQACSISTETSGVLRTECKESVSHALGREATNVAAEKGKVNHLPNVDTFQEAKDADVPERIVKTEQKHEAVLTDVEIVAPPKNSEFRQLGTNFQETCVKPDFQEPCIEAKLNSKESHVPVNEKSSPDSSPRRKLDLPELCAETKLESCVPTKSISAEPCARTEQSPSKSCDRTDDSPEKLVGPAVRERIVPKGTDVVSPVKVMSNRPCFMRPVPRLDSGGRIRKNSVQGSGASASESEDEYGKRTVPLAPNRVRNDSVCSSVQSNRESVDNDQTDFPRVKTTQKRRMLFSESARKLAEARKEFLLKHENKTPDRSQLKMYDLIYYNPVTNPMKKAPETPKRIPITPSTETAEEEEEEDDPTAMPVPRVKVGPDGQLIIDEQSLVIESSTVKRAKEILSTDIIVEDENCHSGGFYKKRKRGKDWPNWETVKFYQVLNVVGTDFVLMQTLFPNRTRQEIKQKYKKEERVNCHLIQKALKYHQKFDTEMLEKQLAMLQKLEHIQNETRKKSSKRHNDERCATKAAKKRRHRMVAKSIGECESSSVNDAEDREEDLSDEIDSEASGETSDTRYRRVKRGSKSRKLTCSNISNESDDDGSRATAQECKSTKVDSDSDPEIYRVRPTRSGRLPKSKKFRSDVNVKRSNDNTKDLPSSVDGTAATSSREATVVDVPADDGDGIVTPENLATVIPNIDKMKPGSWVILSKKSTQEPENTILQVYMVSSNTANAEDECDVTPVDLPPKFLTVTDKLNEAESTINASDDCEQ